MYEFAVTPAVTQLRRPGVTITEVTPGSVADELDLEPSDRIVKVNGRTVRDYLDFRFQTAGETELTFHVRKPKGETIEIEFDREEGEDLGLMFEQIVPRQCERVHILLLQRESCRRTALAFCPRRRHPPFIPLR